MSRIELHRLRYFVVLAQELHFRAAAEKLHIAQPPLTNQIKKLEQDIGVALFKRSRRHVELTPAGHAFLAEVKGILKQVDSAAEAARRADRGEVGQLEIGYASSADLQVLPTVVPAFRAKYPGVRLRFRSLFFSDQVAALRSQRIDVGLVRLPGIATSDLTFESILKEALIVALPSNHRLARRPFVSLRQLTHEPYIIFPRQFAPGFYDAVTGAFERLGTVLNIVEEADHIQLNLSLIAMGDGVSLLPESLRYLKRAGVSYLPLRPDRLETELGMVYRRNDTSPILWNFIRAVRDRLVNTVPSRRSTRPSR